MRVKLSQEHPFPIFLGGGAGLYHIHVLTACQFFRGRRQGRQPLNKYLIKWASAQVPPTPLIGGWNVASDVKTGRVNHQTVCGKKFWVKDGVVQEKGDKRHA